MLMPLLVSTKYSLRFRPSLTFDSVLRDFPFQVHGWVFLDPFSVLRDFPFQVHGWVFLDPFSVLRDFPFQVHGWVFLDPFSVLRDFPFQVHGAAESFDPET